MANEETTAQLSKYFGQSEIVNVMRSQIHPAEYNPRKIDDEGKKLLRKSVKSYGVLGGIIVNKQTQEEVDGMQHYTIVGGHQKVFILDDINKYDEETGANDYGLRVEVIDVDLKTEKQINVILNNPSVAGTYDWDKLRAIIPDIDYKAAGLSEADLSMIGVDYLFKTEKESSIADELEEMMKPADEAHRQDVEEQRRQREAIKEAQRIAQEQQAMLESEELEDGEEEDEGFHAEKTREEKIQHMKDVKAQVKEQAMQRAADNEAYLMLSFDNFENKKAFCEKFGLNPWEKFYKGEAFSDIIDNVMDDSMDD